MKNFKKVLSFVMATILCLSFSVTAFAAEPAEPADSATDTTVTEENLPEIYMVSSDGTLSLLGTGTVSGYGNATLTRNNAALIVKCTASGIGGMGITVDTQCSTTANVTLIGGVAYTSSVLTSTLDAKITTNGHYEFHNLHQSGDFGYYLIGLDGIPDGVEVKIDVWIYG